jgi:glycosyl transferase family 25
MSSQTQVYVVNLVSDIERRQFMETTLAERHVTAQFFTAVDGRVMDACELETHVDRVKAEKEYGPLSRAEIGTALSHIHIYRDMVARDIPYAVILEDDVHLCDDFLSLVSPQSPDCLEQLFTPEEPVMLQLSYVNLAYRRRDKRFGTNKRSAAYTYGGVWHTSGYFITLAAAKRLAQDLYPVWAVADYWNRFEQRRLVGLWTLTPNAVWQSAHAQQSNISAERTRRPRPPKTLKSRAARIWHEMIIKPFFVRRLPEIS